MRYSTHEYWRDPECGPIRGGRLTRASTPIVTYLCTGPYGIGRACTTVCCEEYPEHHDSSEEDMPVEDQPNAEEANSRGFLADSDSMEDDTDTDSIDYLDEPEDGEDPEEDPSEEHKSEDEETKEDEPVED
ncbi:hypothetical protein Tco_0119823, partial [Tanacetum coccineum]